LTIHVKKKNPSRQNVLSKEIKNQINPGAWEGKWLCEIFSARFFSPRDLPTSP